MSAFPFYKEILGLFAVVLAVWGLWSYIKGIFVDGKKPHIYSWIVWTLMTGVVAWGQLVSNGGPGAWTTVVTTVLSLAVVVLAIKYGTKDRTRFDLVMFSLSLLFIPIWLATDNPMYAVVLATFIDLLAFLPTIRKSWHNPQQEGVFLYKLNVVRHVSSILALGSWSVTTVLFPAAVAVLNIVLLAVIYRKRPK